MSWITGFVQSSLFENGTEIAVFFQPGQTTVLSLRASLASSSDHEITMEIFTMENEWK